MSKVFVKPVEGVLIRHPMKKSYILPPEGELVELSRDWRRLIRFGDVVVVENGQSKVEHKLSNGGEE